jgi:hypothetical protein
MVKARDLQGAQALRKGRGREPGKAQLQRQMEEARESISQTVEEIKDTVEDQYQSVKETVSGVLDYREQFQKDPIVWSVGALAAGFALGYPLGYAHKKMKPAGRKRSELAAFADTLVDELSTLGQSLVMPSLNAKIKQLFGFDLSDMLEEIGGAKKTRGRKKALRKGGAKKKSQGARRRVPTVRR